jgi:chorismate dehydratase
MTAIRLGAVSYLNARPLVYGLDQSPRFSLCYDVPSECARRLHAGDIDIGLIPSIEYLRADGYRIVPDLAIASNGLVASVALFTTRPMGDVRTIAMDASSRTSVALVQVLCARLFRIKPTIHVLRPDLNAMLARGDAALLIGDNALLLDPERVRLTPESPAIDEPSRPHVEKIDLGAAWTELTGLPFVWAFWAGRQAVLHGSDVEALQNARDAGVGQADAIARDYFRDRPEVQESGARYLRDNIKYHLGGDERAGLEMFFQYALEAGLAPAATKLRFYWR